jgi:hypothetical protein
MKERIKELLGQGISPAIVASAVGCTPSYISQLMAEESFATEVAELRCSEILEDSDWDSRLDSLENKLIEKLEHLVPMMLRPREVLEALTKINSLKRRTSVASSGQNLQTAPTVIVNLQLPSRLISTYSLSKTNEVIGISQTADGVERSLAGMPSIALMKELSSSASLSSSQTLEIEELTNASPDFSQVSSCADEKSASPPSTKDQRIQRKTISPEHV